MQQRTGGISSAVIHLDYTIGLRANNVSDTLNRYRNLYKCLAVWIMFNLSINRILIYSADICLLNESVYIYCPPIEYT